MFPCDLLIQARVREFVRQQQGVELAAWCQGALCDRCACLQPMHVQGVCWVRRAVNSKDQAVSAVPEPAPPPDMQIQTTVVQTHEDHLRSVF